MLSASDTPPPKILVLEDDRSTGTLLKAVLSRHGFEINWIMQGEFLLTEVSNFKPAVVILDNVPGLPCTESTKLLRSNLNYRQLPLIVYSGIDKEVDLLRLLELGADDCIPKIYSPTYLAERIKLLLKRTTHKTSEHSKPSKICVGSLSIDASNGQVLVGERPTHLSPSEFEILHLLAARTNQVISRRELRELWRGPRRSSSASRVIDVLIVRLRKKLKGTNLCIESKRGVGYRLIEKHAGDRMEERKKL